MRMRIVVFCLIAGMLATPMDGLAQSTSTNNWTAITTVASGQKLVIELKSGKKVTGKFGSASETAVTLARGKKTEDINRSDIRKVFREKGLSVPKRTLRGTAIGAGAGAVVGLAIGGCDKPNGCVVDRGVYAAAGGVVGATVGALTGFVRGLLSHRKTLIYEVP